VLPSQDSVYCDLGLLVIHSHDNKDLEVILKWFDCGVCTMHAVLATNVFCML